MSERAVYVRVGLLLFAGLALGLALIWFLGGQRIGKAETAESYFSESVQGLEVGAAVKYRGVTLGRVTDIGLVSAEYPNQSQAHQTNYRLVFVRYVVDGNKTGNAIDTDHAVAMGLRVRLAAQGITGLSYLELDFVNPASYPAAEITWKPKGVYVPSVPSTLSQVQNAAQQVLAKLNGLDLDRVVGSVVSLMQELQQQVSQGAAHDALQQVTQLGRTLQQNVEQADLPRLADDLRRTSAAYRDIAQSGDVRSMLTSADRAANGLARAAAQLPPVIAGLQSATQRVNNSTADLQQALAPLLRDMQATAQNLRETTELLRQYPAQVLSQPPRRTPETGR